MWREKRGFTLIELLIVIAIILILIAIALPNFLEAQVRAKVTKAMAQEKSIGIAIESYQTDFKTYPPSPKIGEPWWLFLNLLTTPISYMKGGVPRDPFGPMMEDYGIKMGQAPYLYMAYDEKYWKWAPQIQGLRWILYSAGPDAFWDWSVSSGVFALRYSPTNGTTSRGDLTLSNKGLQAANLRT